MSHRRAPTAVALSALGVLPGTASAHSPVAGIEGFYAGLAHPATAPGQLLVLAALGVLLGLGGTRLAAASWAAFAAALLAGIAAGQFGAAAAWADLPLLLVAVAAAVLAALLSGRAGLAALALSACGGLLVGLGSTPDPGPPLPTAVTLAGSFVGANLGLLYVAGITGWLRGRATAAWMHVGLRVLAAWIAAIATLMAALTAAPQDEVGGTPQLSQNHHLAVTEAEWRGASQNPT